MEEGELKHTREESTISVLLRICVYTIAFVGVQFAWSTELALTTPYFASSLNASSTLNHLVWAGGPISGFIVGPIVGIYSDGCQSRLGRRRPFLIGGLISSVLAMAVFCNSLQIGHWITSDSNVGPIIIGYISFLFMDLSINTIQGPLRALVSDLIDRKYQNMGQSVATAMQASGACLASGVIITMSNPSNPPDIEYVFTAAMVLMIFTTCITIIFSREEQHFAQTKGAFYQPFVDVGREIFKMKSEMMKLCLVQFTIWMAWFTFLPTSSSWMGEVAYGGNADAPKDSPSHDAYSDGLRFASLANIGQAVLQLLTSMVCPILVKYFGMRAVYGSSYILQGLCFVTIGLTKNRWVGLTCIGLAGISFATTNIFPFALVGDYYKSESRLGVNMGILNWFIVIPQLLDTTWTGYVSGRRMNSTFLQADGCNIFIGGLFAFTASALTLIVVVPVFFQFNYKKNWLGETDPEDILDAKDSMLLGGGGGH